MKIRMAVLSISYGDYLAEKGGVNKVIFAHQHMMNESGIDYYYIYPVAGLANDQTHLWHLVINGQRIKEPFTSDTLWESFKENSINISNIFIHHIIRIGINALTEIIERIHTDHVFFYIHDFYTLCQNYTLLRDGKNYCNVHGKNEKDCKTCKFFDDNQYHIEEIKEFFKCHENVIAVAPSDAALNIWLAAYPFMKERAICIYHQKFLGSNEFNKEKISDRVINIAYVGTCTYAKGWDDYCYVVSQLYENCKGIYRFWAFGNGIIWKLKHPHIHLKGVQLVQVNATNRLDAMVNKLREKKIDVVFLGSVWPETYAYTYYEALASNAFVIANINSGNIAAQVQMRKNGYIYTDKKEVIELLMDSKKVNDIVNRHKETTVSGPEQLIENDEILRYMDINDVETGDGISPKTVNWKRSPLLSKKERFIARFDSCVYGRKLLMLMRKLLIKR